MSFPIRASRPVADAWRLVAAHPRRTFIPAAVIASAGLAYAAFGPEIWQASLVIGAQAGGQLSGTIAFETGGNGILVTRIARLEANTVIHDGFCRASSRRLAERKARPPPRERSQ